MPTNTAHLAPSSAYAALLSELRIAALRALADILATSDDPTEKRHAATAILRAPEPDAPNILIRPLPEHPPVCSYYDQTSPPSLQSLQGSQSQPTQPAVPALPPNTFDPAKLERSVAKAREILTRAGIPIDENDDLSDLSDQLDERPLSPAGELARNAGQAPSG